jgi:hypothetical protein
MNLIKGAIGKGTALPKPVVYEDIDRAFQEWVEKDLYISFEGKELPTMVLYSNQRFSEYLQTWKYTDENNNVLLNFKTISREYNPSFGKDQGNNYNIPGEPYFLMARQIAHEPSGRLYYIDYKIRQPFTVDFSYKVNIISNKLEVMNTFNMMVVDKFKAKQCYLNVNGHHMPMLLETVSDESEYSISDRQFYSQSFSITLEAYIIKPEDMIVEETPVMAIKYMGDNETQRKKMVSLLPDMGCPEPEDNRYYETLRIEFDPCMDDKVTFNTKANNLTAYFYEMDDNISYFLMSVDDGEWVKYGHECPEDFHVVIPEETKVKIRVRKYNKLITSVLSISAFDTNRAIDFSLNDPTEFRPDEGSDEKPMQIEED